jgi:hypothetical protein
MNETEMSAYWFTLSAYFPTWTMPNVDDDAGLATRSVWCHAFRDVSFVDARDAIEALPPSRFAPSLGELVAAAKGTATLRVVAGSCFGKLRSVINSFGDLEAKKVKCDQIDSSMWQTIEAMGGLVRIGLMTEEQFNSSYMLSDWVKTYIDVANGARSQVVQRKSLPGAIKDSLGEIMKRRPQIEGGLA